jgi:hypothetical protein
MKCPICVESGLKSTIPIPTYNMSYSNGIQFFPPKSYYDEDGNYVTVTPPTPKKTFTCSLGHTFQT